MDTKLNSAIQHKKSIQRRENKKDIPHSEFDLNTNISVVSIACRELGANRPGMAPTDKIRTPCSVQLWCACACSPRTSFA